MLFSEREKGWGAPPSSLFSSASSVLGEAEATAKSEVSEAELKSFEVDECLNEADRLLYLLQHGNVRQKAAGLRYLPRLDDIDVGETFSNDVAHAIASGTLNDDSELVFDALDSIGRTAYGDCEQHGGHWLFFTVHSHNACAARSWLAQYRNASTAGQLVRCKGRCKTLTRSTLRSVVLSYVLRVLEKDCAATASLSARLAIAILINDCTSGSGVEVRQAIATAIRVASRLGGPGSQPAYRRVHGCQLLGAICATLGNTAVARSKVESFLDLALGLCQDTDKESVCFL